MHKTIRTFLVLALMLAAARAQATPGTCTVSNIDVITTLFPFPKIGGNGLQIPVDIDAPTGQITMDRDAYTTAFPSPGLRFDTGFGSIGWLEWSPGPIAGTIDSNGQITFDHFGMRFLTDYATPGQASPAGDLDVTFTSALQALTVAGASWVFSGSPVSSQGQVTLTGASLINFVAVLQTGPRMTCTLTPAVDLASLPKGATLASAKGQVKKGTDPSAPDDSLALTAVMVAGATQPVLDGSQNVLLRFQAAGQPLNILVPSGSMTPKGKKLSVKDVDGSGGVFQAIPDVSTSSDDQTASPPATKGGSLIVKKGKKRSTFIFKVDGVDASSFSGPVTVTLGVGTLDAVRQVTFTATKKGLKFH